MGKDIHVEEADDVTLEKEKVVLMEVRFFGLCRWYTGTNNDEAPKTD